MIATLTQTDHGFTLKLRGGAADAEIRGANRRPLESFARRHGAHFIAYRDERCALTLNHCPEL